MRNALKVSMFLVGGAQAVFGQSAHDHDAMPGMHHPAAATAAAKAEIAKVAKAVAPLGTTASARESGYAPVFGWIPTMGEHWVNRAGLRAGVPTNVMRPNNLMFSRIDGRDSLVGAAYAYYVNTSDTTRPAFFDGAPAWHEHADLAPEGQTLAMLHVWFVPSPDGPFAGHNPNLPFWALGMTPPEAARFADHAESMRIRKVALALGVVADTAGLFPQLMQRPEVRAAVVEHREAIRTLLPKLDARGVTDWASWDRSADEAAKHWDAVRAAYLATVRTPAIRQRMINVMDE